jgi:DNA primase small subunit
VDDFDPETVPTIWELMKELDEAPMADPEQQHGTSFHPAFLCLHQCFYIDWERTSMKAYVNILEKHVLALMSDVRETSKGTGIVESSSGN